MLAEPGRSVSLAGYQVEKSSDRCESPEPTQTRPVRSAHRIYFVMR